MTSYVAPGHMLVQIVSLACWYPLSDTGCVSCRSFLLLSVFQIVDSRPSWILLSVLGELCSTSRIGDILPIHLNGLLSLNTLSYVYWLFLVCGFICFGMMGKNPLYGLSPHLFLFRFAPCLCSICISLLHHWLYLSSFQ